MRIPVGQRRRTSNVVTVDLSSVHVLGSQGILSKGRHVHGDDRFTTTTPSVPHCSRYRELNQESGSMYENGLLACATRRRENPVASHDGMRQISLETLPLSCIQEAFEERNGRGSLHPQNIVCTYKAV